MEIFLEKINGLDFSSVIPVKRLGLDESVVGLGSPSNNKYLKQLFEVLNITQKDSILDIGCAKGAAMRCMCKFQFKKIGGIEISDILAKIAQSNFNKLKEHRVEIANTNATSFKNYKDYNFFYLYNPFPKEVMLDVLSQIKSQIKNENEIILIYNNPTCHELFLEKDYFLIAKFPDMWGNGIFVYSNLENSERLNHIQSKK